MTHCVRAWLATLTAASALVLGAPGHSHAVAGDECRDIDAADDPSTPATDPGRPLETLQIAEARQLVTDLSGRAPGAGVRVAVVDSGVRAFRGIGLRGSDQVPGFSTAPTPAWFHGTAMAGVIAGGDAEGRAIGIAPAATVYDLQVYDTDEPVDEAAKVVTVEGLTAGLERLVPLVGRSPGEIDVVNISLRVPHDDALEAVVRRITRAGAIVVASSGDRPGSPEPGAAVGGYELGEDYADAVFPAGYAHGDRNPRVVAVGTTTDASEGVDQPVGVLNSAIDVAVPTFGAVSYAVNTATCALTGSSTSVAAAEVSGIIALLMTVYPGDSPDRIIDRLEATATGGSAYDPSAPDRALGRGLVQPIDALTRPLPPDSSSVVGPARRTIQDVAPATLPVPEPDLLHSTRRNILWWGLVGGGALVIAMVLRPALSRRR